ncbi:hypothetical protein [Natrialba taiwanensis]|uniref:hypothetical protein n=1 Tax=Natrialba taiwanensis TaxID=160846 RepID=UPI0019552ABA|nr:hypothetical protein [Natrialba taiwanensis]
MTPPEILIALLWVTGLLLVSKAQADLSWRIGGAPPKAQSEPRGIAKRKKEAGTTGVVARHPIAVFLLAAVTLGGGITLERSSSMLASGIGVSGAVFGATMLAAVTALPEVSTGLTAVRLGDYRLAISDIFGGNAFLPVLFLVVSVVSGQAVLPALTGADIYLAGLGSLLTTVYITGVIFRPPIPGLATGA